MIKDYKVVMGMKGMKEFEEQVLSLAKEGYVPSGGVAVTMSTDVVKGAVALTFYQAMSLHE